jgi:dienelactone hydrolase
LNRTVVRLFYMRRCAASLLRKVRQRTDLLLALAALAFCTADALISGPGEPPVVREDLRIPGPADRYTLALAVLRPRGDGPFGAVVLNHGVGLTSEERAEESVAPFLHTAAVFVERGYAVIMPLRRGFGATGGSYAENPGSCGNPDFKRGEAEAASDVLTAYRYARKLPYIDGSRIILAGQSAGGVASLYAAAQSPPGLVAVLAFAAGRGADPLRHPGVPCAAQRLASVFEELGKGVHVPVLLYYAQNDLSFGPEVSRAWFRSFNAAGARAEYVLQPPFGEDGHGLFTDPAGVALWAPTVERFLSRYGIPFKVPEKRT